MKLICFVLFIILMFEGAFAEIRTPLKMESEWLFPQYASGCAYAGSIHDKSKPWDLNLKINFVTDANVLYAEFEGASFVSHFCKAESLGFPSRVKVPVNSGASVFPIQDEPNAARRNLKLSFQLQLVNDQIFIQSYCTWDHWCGKSGFVIHQGQSVH